MIKGESSLLLCNEGFSFSFFNYSAGVNMFWIYFVIE